MQDCGLGSMTCVHSSHWFDWLIAIQTFDWIFSYLGQGKSIRYLNCFTDCARCLPLDSRTPNTWDARSQAEWVNNLRLREHVGSISTLQFTNTLVWRMSVSIAVFVSKLHCEQVLCWRYCLGDTFVSLSKEHDMPNNRMWTTCSMGTDY